MDPGVWDLIAGPVNPQAVLQIAAALTFLNGFLTYLLGSIGSRRGYVRYRLGTYATMILLTSASVPIWISATLPLDRTGAGGFLFRFGIGQTVVAFAAMAYVLYHVVMIENVAFSKPNLFVVPKSQNDSRPSHHAVEPFGVGCIDSLLAVAAKEQIGMYYPVLLLADEQLRPWRFCTRFAVEGVIRNQNIIYFAFNRPASVILRQIEAAFQSRPESRTNASKTRQPVSPHDESYPKLVIVDCHSRWTTSGQDRTPQLDQYGVSRWARVTFLNSDPRDPIELSEIYAAALANLASPNPRRVRVVYDSISDFLCFSDPTLAAQFLKHNLVWEDRNRLTSLYVYVRGVPGSGTGSQVDQRFMEWNCNSELELAFDKDGCPSLTARAVFSTPRGAKIQWDPSLGDYTVLHPDHAFKEAHTRELSTETNPPSRKE